MIAIVPVSSFCRDDCFAGTDTGAKGKQEFRTIKDLDDRIIEVPAYPRRIAMLHGPSYDRILMLGKPDVIAIMPLIPTEWALKIFPEIKNIPAITSYVDVDVEQMLKHKVDLVFYSIHPAQAQKLRAAGIKVVCPFTEKKLPCSMSEFKEHYKRQILFFGEILGGEAMRKAKKYCDYFDRTVNRILSITSSIPENKRPRVYYGGLNGDLFSTQGRNTVMYWCVTAAGGNFLTMNYKKHYAKVSVEQFMAWDPEFIFIGRKGTLDLVKDNPALKNTKAFQRGDLYRIPVGTFWWDLASGETILLPLFLAKKFYPHLFKDWDILREMEYFYSEFYNYSMSGEDAQRILEALPPE